MLQEQRHRLLLHHLDPGDSAARSTKCERNPRKQRFDMYSTHHALESTSPSLRLKSHISATCYYLSYISADTCLDYIYYPCEFMFSSLPGCFATNITLATDVLKLVVFAVAFSALRIVFAKIGLASFQTPSSGRPT